MAMTGAGMAEAIRVAMGFPLPVSTQLNGWGTGVVGHIQGSATVDHLPGDVTGTCPGSGGALTGGAADDGTIFGMVAATMASAIETAAGYPSVSTELTKFCTEIISHIQGSGVVEFGSGDITGNCTNTALSPGDLEGGAGANGFIKSLDGPTLALAIHNSVGYPGGVSTPLTQFCTAIVDYIGANAVASYSSGNVTGGCPAGGGALEFGGGTNGVIS